jgi:hypothetical protein
LNNVSRHGQSRAIKQASNNAELYRVLSQNNAPANPWACAAAQALDTPQTVYLPAMIG